MSVYSRVRQTINSYSPVDSDLDEALKRRAIPFEQRVATATQIIPSETKPLSLLQRVQQTIKGLPERIIPPSPEGVRQRDIARELLPATIQVAKNIGQSIARSFLATSKTITDIPEIIRKVTDKPEGTLFQDIKKAIKEVEFKPETRFETALAGTTEPVSFESIGTEVLSIFGENFVKKHEELAFPVGLLIAGLDVTPFGGTKKGAFQALKEANTLGDATSVLTKMGVSDDLARFFAEDVVKVTDDKAAKTLFEHIANVQKTTKITPTPFLGYKDLTTKFLEDIKGKTILSKQEILDFARRPELKKGEADLLYNLAKDLPEGKLPAQEFADSIRRDLLPLKPVKVISPQYGFTTIGYKRGGIPSNTRYGKNYEEVVFESPISTNGSSHYPNSKNYFAHARGDEVVEKGKKIWREQEIQSDLLQKEGLERAKPQVSELKNGKFGVYVDNKPIEFNTFKKAQNYADKQIEKLSPFINDRFGERIMRERIKAKAQAGYEKYRLPTGETIGKIEGFQTPNWWVTDGNKLIDKLSPEQMKIGQEVAMNVDQNSKWIITDILTDGRFKAVQKNTYDMAKQNGISPASMAEQETFDLTGKSNPQYRRYENWGKFLKNKFGGKQITDPQGNTWAEIDLTKILAKQPVEAFGVFAGIEQDDEGKITFDPRKAALGFLALSMIKNGVPTETANNTVSAIQKLIKAIDDSVPLRGAQKKLYQLELAKRTARVAAMGEKIAGEKGFFAQLGQLKGELPKKQFEAIRKQFTQKEVDLLFDTIEQTKILLPLEKVATKEGLRKLFEGVVPTPSDIEHLKEVFPKELIDAVLTRRPWLEKAKDIIGELWNVSRSIMATLDLSAPFRQGIFMLGRPIQFAQAFKDMFKFFISEKAYQGLIEGIKMRPTYLKMKQGRLALTEIGGPLLKREERFMSQLAEKIPGFGILARASNRAYTGFLNKLRADIFDDILKKAEIIGRDIDEPLLRSMGDFINAGTGRGKYGLAETGIIPKSMEKAAVILNGAFFSPRLMASRLNLLNPYFYIQLDPLVRKEALKTLFTTSGILGSVYGLWKLNNGDVGINPRSADFGKLKIGNTRYDILGGFQQYVKLAAQLITGEIVSSTTGRTITLGEGYKPLTRKDIILRFFESKESPIASFLTGWLTQQTATGQDFDVPTEIINRFIPMVVQDLYDISQEDGAEGLLMGLPAIFGVGVQTYGKQELVTGESKIGEPTTQIRPVPELGEKIRELVLGQLPLGTSKSFSVETYFDQMSNLSREEAAQVFDEIAKTNPELAKKLSDVVKERELGITVEDKDLKAKGVASGDRALAVKKNMDKLDTKEEKAILWDDYVRKKIITKDVSTQLMKLYNK